MNLGWLKTAGKIVVKGSKIALGVVSAVHAVEAVSLSTGLTKEEQAIALVPGILDLVGLGDKARAPEVQLAIRETMQAYVAAQNARAAAEEALAQFEDAKDSLEAVITGLKH